MFNALYNIFVMPIQMLVEMVYSVMIRVLENQGLSIIAVSLVIQTLILPLYKRSDAMQEQEMQKQSEMSHWVNHIKKTFKGDERFMMLSTYYRQQNYKTYYGLKSSITILLQIPFFLAGYNFLSHLPALKGAPFAFIPDLGAPDQLIHIMGVSINLLPILMTLFNVISGVIYTKGQPLRAKIQVYGLAVVFLILLYNSPSGLVLYWTMNNLYSLLKNVFMKLVKYPVEVISGAMIFVGVGGYFWIQKYSTMTIMKQIALLAFVLLAIIILAGKIYKNVSGKAFDRLGTWVDNLKMSPKLFIWEAMFFAILLGYFIPVSVLSSSATEFAIAGGTPGQLLMNNLMIYIGVFLVWFSVFYFLMTERARKIFVIGLYLFAGVSIVNFMVYGDKAGEMTPMLAYLEKPVYTIKQMLINIAILIAVMIVLGVLLLKLSKVAKAIIQICILCMLVLCGINTNSVHKQMKELEESFSYGVDGQIFTLSKKGKNVIVLMLDRAIGGYIPYIFDECPEIAEEFSGFTYYPNTLSYGMVTNYCASSVFGGYEYTPTAMNERSDELLEDKHNEALCVLPVLFRDNGYDVTVCDPPYAGYTWTPDLSIYDEFEDIDAYMLEGTMRDRLTEVDQGSTRKAQKSNFVYYGLVKIMPLAIQDKMYYEGGYFSTEKSTYEHEAFYDWYIAMKSLTDLTEIADDDSNNFLMMQNSITHEPIVMPSATYTPTPGIDEDAELAKQEPRVENGYELHIVDQNGLSHYQTNLLAYKLLAEWFRYLKENDVYDNTKIIIVADHGRSIDQFDYMLLSNGVDVQAYNPVLMVKDFDSEGFVTSDEFMTTADVPTLTVQNVIEQPYNPFTGKLISNDVKYEQPQRITSSRNYDTKVNNGNVFDTSDGVWYEVKDNIFDVKNWKQVKP